MQNVQRRGAYSFGQMGPCLEVGLRAAKVSKHISKACGLHQGGKSRRRLTFLGNRTWKHSEEEVYNCPDETQTLMIVNRKVDRLLILVLPLVFVVYLSTRPTYQLQEEPPPEFLRAQSDWPPKRRAAEEQLARAYWKCAVNAIEWRYAYGENLPNDPPPEFTSGETSPGGLRSEDAATARGRYWQRLRRVWILPHVWRTNYSLSFAWVARLLTSFGDWATSLWQSR